MAERDPTVPQSDDTEALAETIRVLNIVGPLGRFNVLDTIIPTFSMGEVAQQTIQVVSPSFRSTDIFSTGIQVNAAAGLVLADTGQLAVGTYDMLLQMSSSQDEVATEFQVQFRNAANAANVAVWPYVMRGTDAVIATLTFALEIAANERLRIVNIAAGAGTDRVAATIFARVR